MTKSSLIIVKVFTVWILVCEKTNRIIGVENGNLGTLFER